MKRALLLMLVLILGASLCLFSCDNENTANSGNNDSYDNEDNLDNTPPPTLEYELSEDGSYYRVIGIGTYTHYDLIIPEEHEGKPVKEIHYGAFLNCPNIVYATVPDTITTIPHNAFSECFNLVSITIGKNVTEIQENGFENCHKLVEVINKSPSITITNDESNGSVGLNALSISNAEEGYTSKITIEDNGYVIYNNEDAKYLMGSIENQQRIVVDNGINGIYEYAFYVNSNVVWLEVNSTLKFIGEHAFDGCYNLLSAVLNEQVLEIGNKAFYDCRKLSEAVSKKGPYIQRGTETGWLGTAKSIYNSDREYVTRLRCTDDGFIFFNRNLTSSLLIGYIGDETELTLPKETEFIGSYAFANNDKIKKISFNKGLESIGYGAFENCTSLESVVFWQSSLEDLGIDRWGMRIIESKAFAGCTALSEIFIPKEVVEIKPGAFASCKELKIFCEHSHPTSDIFQQNWYSGIDCRAYYYSYNEPSWDRYEYIDFWHTVDGEKVIWERPE